jgi:predicted acetyltransferase
MTKTLIEVMKAPIEQKPALANLLELYAYDFTEFCDFNIGDDGFYGYKPLPLYWTESTHFPYLIYVNRKIAGFILIQKGSPIADDTEIWDISELFVMKKYQRHGVGTAAAFQIWDIFKGLWQVRVLLNNHKACSFWPQAIKKFTSLPLTTANVTIKGEDWIIYTFESKNNNGIVTTPT